MKMLNIGCGAWHHPDWVNIDLESHAPEVMAHDVSKGLPFEAADFDVCYSSHVLEHLRPGEADTFLGEQHRVLKPGGVIRIVVPDLERICRLYLAYLEELISGNHVHEFEYDYSLLELFDQTTRDHSGGDLRKAWERLRPEHRDYVLSRHGSEAAGFLERQAASRTAGGDGGASRPRPSLRKLIRRGRIAAAQGVVRLLLGQRGVQAFREGLFRNRGEIHRVMYDRYRLSQLLSRHHFTDIAVCEANQSRIPAFGAYQLDVVDGKTRKPDSIFIEAVKPG